MDSGGRTAWMTGSKPGQDKSQEGFALQMRSPGAVMVVPLLAYDDAALATAMDQGILVEVTDDGEAISQPGHGLGA